MSQILVIYTNQYHSPYARVNFNMAAIFRCTETKKPSSFITRQTVHVVIHVSVDLESYRSYVHVGLLRSSSFTKYKVKFHSLKCLTLQCKAVFSYMYVYYCSVHVVQKSFTCFKSGRNDDLINHNSERVFGGLYFTKCKSILNVYINVCMHACLLYLGNKL